MTRRRNEVLQVRMYPMEKRMLQKLVQSRGLPASYIVRELLKAAAMKVSEERH